jgi:hypothetical protein
VARTPRRPRTAPRPGGGFNPPGQLTLTVTAADIRNGERHSACNDAVARAAARLISVPRNEQWVAVGKNTIGISYPESPDEMFSYDLPLEAREFIAAFDDSPSLEFGSFTFTATLHLGDIADGEY